MSNHSRSLDDIPWARRLKLRHFEVFLAVHETGSLTAAAALLNMTQPAMSHWLSDLESVVGGALFIRKPRLALTDAGQVLRAHAQRTLGDVRRTNVELLAVQGGLTGHLKIGTTLPQVLVPRAIANLRQLAPRAFVSVVESSLPDLLERLARCEVDVIVGALSAMARASGFAVEPMVDETVSIVAPCGHPLAGRRGVGWSDALRHPWVLPPRGSVMRGVVDEAFAAQGVSPPVPSVEAHSSFRVHLLGSGSDYLSVLARTEVELYRPLNFIEAVALTPVIRFPDIGAIWAGERAGPLMSHLLVALRAAAAALHEESASPASQP